LRVFRLFAATLLAVILLATASVAAPTRGSVTAGTAWPVSVGADHRSFEDARGRRTLLVGDTAWSLMVALRKPAVIRYLDDRADRGVNLIVVNLVEHAFSPRTPAWTNAYGAAPFRRLDDFTTMVDAYFDHAEWVVAEAEKRGIGVLLAPAYMGASCGGEGWCAEMRANGVDRLEAYGRKVGARFARYRNVIWLHAGDHAPSDADLALALAVRRGIEAASGRALHTFHYQPDVPPGNDDRLKRIDFDTLYSYDVGRIADYVRWARMRDKGVMPFVFVEGVYEKEYDSRSQDWREQFYTTMLGGGAGFVFGNGVVWRFGGGWASHLDGPGSRSLEIAGRFFRSLPWSRLRPESASAVVTGLGDPAVPGSAVAAADPAHGTVLVYFADRRTITVAADRMAGRFAARWFDPSTGRYRPAGGSPYPARGSVTFTPPAAHVDGTTDWVLVLKAT
jgi:hypothetical protein